MVTKPIRFETRRSIRRIHDRHHRHPTLPSDQEPEDPPHTVVSTVIITVRCRDQGSVVYVRGHHHHRPIRSVTSPEVHYVYPSTGRHHYRRPTHPGRSQETLNTHSGPPSSVPPSKGSGCQFHTPVAVRLVRVAVPGPSTSIGNYRRTPRLVRGPEVYFVRP